jgi:hypothetical protein
MMVPLIIDIAAAPLPVATDTVPELVRLTTVPEMAPPLLAELMPPEIEPKLVIVRLGVCCPEIAPPSPLMTPVA